MIPSHNWDTFWKELEGSMLWYRQVVKDNDAPWTKGYEQISGYICSGLSSTQRYRVSLSDFYLTWYLWIQVQAPTSSHFLLTSWCPSVASESLSLLVYKSWTTFLRAFTRTTMAAIAMARHVVISADTVYLFTYVRICPDYLHSHDYSLAVSIPVNWLVST